MKKISINVTIPDATLSRMNSVKASLIRQGVEVESVLEAIGVITGKVAESRLSSLDAGTGATIELDGSVQLPPPGAPVQ